MRTVLGAFNSESVNVGTSPVLLDGVAATRPRGVRLSLVVTTGAADVFVGGSNVTTANGKKILANGELALDCLSGLYAVAAAATTVNILEGY